MFRFYDDELHNLILVSDRNFKEIINYSSNYDFHPPLQYLINKITLQLFGLSEFWLSLPSIIFIILTIILAGRIIFMLTGSYKYSLLSGFIIALNPLILLWGSSIRWYPLWTFLAVISIYSLIKLFSQVKKDRSIILKSSMIITLAFSMYLNYQTITLMASFIITALILDLKDKKSKHFHLKRLTPLIAGVIVLFIPYMGIFQNHLGTFFHRKEIYSDYASTSSFISGSYFLFSILFGNSIYPWDIRFITLLIIVLAAGSGIIIYYKSNYSYSLKIYLQAFLTEEKIKSHYTLGIITATLFLLFLIQSLISGSVPARGLMVLPVLFIIVSTVIIYYLIRSKKIKLSFLISICALSFFLIWLMGSYNVLVKQSIHKAGLMDPVREVVELVNKIANTKKENVVVITYDPVLTYYLAKSELSKKIVLISPYKKETDRLLKSVNKMANNKELNFDPKALLIFIQSYPGTLIPLKEKLDNMRRYIFNEGVLMKGPIRLGYDSDAMMKRRFFPSADILDWRYTITVFSPKNSWDIKILEEFYELKVH